MLRRLQMKQEKIQAYLLRVNKLSGVVYKGYLARLITPWRLSRDM